MEAIRDAGVAEAIECARALAPRTGVERVAVPDLAGRLLAEDAVAQRDLPPADTSAMDGWAVRAAGTPGDLRAHGESAAGVPATGAAAQGEAVAVSTGAAMPEGTDAVARREITDVSGHRVRVTEAVAPGRDVRRRGELIGAGAALLPAGHRVWPHEVGAIGALGLAEVLCRRRPRVAILATGAELVPLGTAAGVAEVHDASRHGLAAQARAAGAEVVASATVGDDLEDTVRALRELLDGGDPPDLVVTNGGISGGVHDHVRPALARLGVTEVLRGVRAAPVRPTWLGVRDGCVVLGLPGNPASAAVAFHLLGRPLLGGHDDWWRRGVLTTAYATREGRAELVRCAEGPGGLVAMSHQGPHAITSLAGARVLAWLPEEGTGVAAGEEVPVSRFD